MMGIWIHSTQPTATCSSAHMICGISVEIQAVAPSQQFSSILRSIIQLPDKPLTQYCQGWIHQLFIIVIMKHLLFGLTVLLVLTSAAAPGWIVPLNILSANTFQVITTANNSNSIYPIPAGAPNANSAFGISELGFGPSPSNNINFVVQFLLGTSTSGILVNVTDGTNIVRLSVSTIIFNVSSTYMNTIETFEYFPNTTSIAAGTGFRMSEPHFLQAPLPLTDGHDIVVVHFLRKIKMTKVISTDYFINSQAWRQNSTHFGVGYSVKDNTNLTESGAIVLFFDRTLIQNSHSIHLDIAFGVVINNTFNQMSTQPYYNAGGIIAGFNSFNFPGNEMPRFLFNMTYAVSSSAATVKFLNITFLNIRQRDCGSDAYVPPSDSCEATCPANSYLVAVGGGLDYCSLCPSPCLTCTDGLGCATCPPGYNPVVSGVCSCAAGRYSNVTTSTCELCHPSCVTCNGGNSSQCLTCSPGLIINSGVCSCPSFGQFYNSSTSSCSPCQSPCLTCVLGATMCIDCVPGSFKVGDECVKCPPGQFQNSSNFCQNCSANCSSCLNATTCYVCKPPNYLNSTNSCVPCSSNQYYTGSVCAACDASCQTCWNTASSCTSCPVGKFLLAGVCVNCLTGCNNCTNLTQCFSCTSPLILSGGVCQACPSGQYMDQSVGSCLNCSTNCATCIVFATNCTSCSQPRILQSSVCVDCPNGTVWSTNDGKCIQCAFPCVNCSGIPTNCTACPPLTNLSSGKCNSICSAGKYFEIISGVCRDCPSTCIACANFTSCTACPSGMGLWMGQCAPCLSNQVFNASSGMCQNCQPGCATCPNITNCSTCLPGLVLRGGQCVPCQNGQFFNPVIVECSPCSSICGNCSNNFTCTSCRPPLILSGVACVNCTLGYFFQNTTGTCEICDATCLTCIGIATNCASCAPPAALSASGACVTCPSGNYVNASSGACVVCSASCATCLNASYCLTCPVGKSLSAGICQTCLTNEFSLAGACVSCSTNCLTCLGNANNCTSCPASKGLLPDGTCVNCNSSSFINEMTRACTLCPLECLTCANPQACLTCAPGLALFAGVCKPCRPNQYFDPATRQCANCTVGCFMCNSSSACGGCLPGYQLNSGVCIACTSTQFFNASLMVCQSCPPRCLTCSGLNNCTSCSSPKVLYGGNCVPCPFGQYYDAVSSYCQPCNSSCLTCQDASTCSSCLPPAVLVAASCMSCPVGEYYSTVGTPGCISCPSSCATCSSSANCVSCTAPLILVAGVCQNCSAGQFIAPGANNCSVCDPTCLTCAGTAITCTSCAPPRGLSAGTCVNCTSSQYFSPLTGTCVNCPSGCPVCNSSTMCLNCTAPNVLSAGQCVPCPSDSFYNSTSRTCIGCSLNCLTCNGNSANCTSCPAQKIWASGKCIPCPPGQFISSGSCVACNLPCIQCVGTPTNCTACVPSMFLVAGVCQSCAAAEFWDYTLATPACVACPASCGNCRNASYCLSCPGGQNLAGGVCQTCLANEFTLPSSVTCTACDASCASCFNNATNCTSCSNPKILNGSTCVDCPIGTYFEVLHKGCAKCVPTCLTCSAPTTCTSCDANKFRNLSAGDCVCSTGSSENLMGQCISDTFCYPGFQWNGTGCQEICGDGKVFVLPCDDGNTLDGDGCSHDCQRENDFSCRGGSSANSTECSYSKPLQLQVQRIVKDLKANAVNFTLQLSPPLKVLEEVDFSKLITSNLPLKKIIATYQGAAKTSNGRVGAGPSGTLSVYAEYSTNIQNANCDLTIAPPSGSTGSFDMPASAISFPVVPENGGAYFYDNTVYEGSNRIATILKICLSVGVIALLISIVSNHVSGLEAMHLLQVLFFSFTMIGTVQPTLAGASVFAGTNGYNSLFNDQPTLMDFGSSPTTPVLTTLGLGVRFLQNINIMLVFYAALAVAGLITYLLSITVKGMATKFETITKFIIGDLLLMLGIFNALNAGFSLGIHLLWMNKPDVTPSNAQTGCVITILLSLAFNSLSVGLFFARPTFFSSTKKSLKEEKFSQAEPIVQLCFRFLLGFLIGVLNSFTGASIVAVVVQLIYVVHIVIRRPYTQLIGNVRSLLNNGVAVFVLIVSIIYNFTIVDGQSTVGQGLIEVEIWIVIGVAALGAALTLFNLVKYIRDPAGDKVVPQGSIAEEDNSIGVVKPDQNFIYEKERISFSTTNLII